MRKSPPPADPQEQRALFRAAVAALGGGKAAAPMLPVSERTMRKLLAGEAVLHDGILEDTARALTRHAELCCDLERRLSPAFLANQTEAQRTGAANKGRWQSKRIAMSGGRAIEFAGDDEPIRGKEIEPADSPARSAGSPSSSAKRGRADK